MNLGWILSIGASMLIFLCWGWRSLQTFCVLNMHHSKSVSALNGSFWTHKKSGVQISSRKWNPFVTDEFPYEILILWKRLSVLYMHMLCGWNYDTIPTLMSYGSKLWYFESDCPFCTRSASSFCRNPLYFLEHAMWVKWWYHANFQPFQSSFWNAFQFRSHLAQRMN